MSGFVGRALPMTGAGLEEAARLIDVPVIGLWAVITVETRGVGFLPDRRPHILFERHEFKRRTAGRFDATHPAISGPPGGYGAAGHHQHERLALAIECNRTAAIESASWGLGQIMGFNAEATGYPSAESMVAALIDSEDEQLLATARFLMANHLAEHVRSRDWARFAKGYNGPNYAANRYDEKLAEAYDRFSRSGLPDLNVRAIQVLLTYAGEQPGSIDGLRGPRTDAAIARVTARQGLTPSGLDELEAALLDILDRRDGGAVPLAPQTNGRRQSHKPADVRLLQLALAALGVDPGPIDGVDGPRTRAGLRQVVGNPVPSAAALHDLGTALVGALQSEPTPTRAGIVLLQDLLQRAGEQPGPADGLSGPRTTSAAQRFRQKHGVAPGGLTSPLLFAALFKQAEDAMEGSSMDERCDMS